MATPCDLLLTMRSVGSICKMHWLHRIRWLPSTERSHHEVNFSLILLVLYGVTVAVIAMLFQLTFVQKLTGLNTGHIFVFAVLHFSLSMLPLMLLHKRVSPQKLLLWEIYIDRMVTAALPIMATPQGSYLWIFFVFVCSIEALECGPSVYSGVAVFVAPLIAYFALGSAGLKPIVLFDVYEILFVATLAFMCWYFIAAATQEFREAQRNSEKIAAESEFNALIAEEKTRINEELHDLIGSDLTFLRFAIANPKMNTRRNEWAQRIDKTLLRLRELVKLNSIANDLPQKLPQELREFADEYAAVTDCKLNADIGNVNLSPAQAFHAQRFFAEAITNAAKHASAKSISVRVRSRARHTIIALIDDGKGIAKPKSGALGSGLANMAERARRAGGRFRAWGSKRGTVVALLVPR